MKLSSVSMVSNTTVAPKGNSQSLYMPNYKNSLSADTVSFTGKKDGADGEKPKKSGFVHKALISATGCFIPGMGQAINGQWSKAALFAIGAPLAVFGAMTVSLPLAMGIGLAAEAGMFIDAYRNA